MLGAPALTMFTPFYEDPSEWAKLYKNFFDISFALVFDLSWLLDIQVGSSGCEQGWRRTPTNAADPCSPPFQWPSLDLWSFQLPISISVSIVGLQLVFGPKSTAAAIAVGAAIAIGIATEVWVGVVAGLPLALASMLVQHIFVEYAVSHAKAWEEEARRSSPRWLTILAWCCRVAVVTLMGAAKAILALTSRLNRSEFGA